jgi:hypothetical protein
MSTVAPVLHNWERRPISSSRSAASTTGANSPAGASVTSSRTRWGRGAHADSVWISRSALTTKDPTPRPTACHTARVGALPLSNSTRVGWIPAATANASSCSSRTPTDALLFRTRSRTHFAVPAYASKRAGKTISACGHARCQSAQRRTTSTPSVQAAGEVGSPRKAVTSAIGSVRNIWTPRQGRILIAAALIL